MKQSLVKKLTAGILTGALAISVTACGGNSADTNMHPQMQTSVQKQRTVEMSP